MGLSYEEILGRLSLDASEFRRMIGGLVEKYNILTSFSTSALKIIPKYFRDERHKLFPLHIELSLLYEYL